jgi:adenylate cyclase
MAINLLDTYVGHRAGERILAGQITRGSGQTVEAAIWFCDLRGFTALSESKGRDELLDCLNRFFDCMAGPVEKHGGDILKFMGDGMLAIFPLDSERACRRAVEAAIDARKAMAALNEEQRARADKPLGFGIALHVGEVMYGNIGTADRLDFTVVGPAVNLTSRLEALCRRLGCNVLISDAFCDLCSDSFRSLGTYRLAGISRAVEVFTLPEAAP